jgi:Trypsin-co-occurring domain 1
MIAFAKFPLEGGGSVIVEVDDASAAPRKTMRGGVPSTETMVKATQTFEGALDGVRSASEALLARLLSLAQPPDEISVEFGVKLNAESGAVIAKAAAEANFAISLKWKRSTGGKE